MDKPSMALGLEHQLEALEPHQQAAFWRLLDVMGARRALAEARLAAHAIAELNQKPTLTVKRGDL